MTEDRFPIQNLGTSQPARPGPDSGRCAPARAAFGRFGAALRVALCLLLLALLWPVSESGAWLWSKKDKPGGPDLLRPGALAPAFEDLELGRWEKAAQGFWQFRQGKEAHEEGMVSAGFGLARSLLCLGLRQAATEYFVDIARDSLDLDLSIRALAELEAITRQEGFDEETIVEELLYEKDFSALPDPLHDFVHYYQAWMDFRNGYPSWAENHLRNMKGESVYAQRGRILRALWALKEGDPNRCRSLLEELLASPGIDPAVANEARKALARVLYEQEDFEGAYRLYREIDAPETTLADVILEEAWTKYRQQDFRKAMGLLVAFSAPAFQNLFKPEQDTLKALIYMQFCHYRAARSAMGEFEARYGKTLERIRNRADLSEDPEASRILQAAPNAFGGNPRLEGPSGKAREQWPDTMRTHLGASMPAERRLRKGRLSRRKARPVPQKKALGLILALLCFSWSAPAMARPGETNENERLLRQLDLDLESVDEAIEGTRTLIEQSMHRPYLPDLYMRLAELYVAKSRILYHRKRLEDPTASKALVALDANLLKSKAIDLYAKILEEFPQYAHPDKVLFFMAHEYREMGVYDKMLDAYMRLVERYPQSPYRFEAHLMIGDHHFDTMNLDKAEASYRTILEAPESHVHGMARYKMAWCHINRNRYPEAVELLESLVADPRYDEQKTEIDVYKKMNLRREALVDLAYCYTEVRKPEEALEYFARLADSKSLYLAVLDKLGQRYFLKEDWASAGRVYAKILSLCRDITRAPEYAEKLFACAQKARTLDKPDENVRLLVRTLADIEYDWRMPDEAKMKWRKDLELYARDMATRLHVEAKEKKDPVLAGQAADAYKHYLAFFREGAFSRDLLHNQAEALFLAKRYFKAAEAYEKLASATQPEEAGLRRDFLYDAIVAYQRALKEEEGLDDLQKLEARQALRQIGGTYLASYPGGEEAPEVAFNVAWVAYEQGDYGTALSGFKDFLHQYPQSPEAKAAGHLILDIHKSLDNIEGLVADARSLLEDRRISDPGFRKEIEAILVASERRLLEEVTVKVKDDVEGSESVLVALGTQAQDTGLRETALYNLFVVNKQARQIPRALEAGRKLLDAFPQSEHRGDVESTLAHFCFEAADFAGAAAWSERAAQSVQAEEQAEHWLRAAKLYGWMGEIPASIGSYRKALSLVGTEKRLEAQKDLLERLEEAGAWRAAAETSASLMAEEPGQPRWTVRYGNALLRQGRSAEAYGAFEKALAQYRQKAGPTGGASAEDKASFAEARFRLAERDLETFRSVSLKSGALDNSVVQKKMNALQALEAASLEVAQIASPRWTIASLDLAARANEDLVSFLLGTPVPEDLTLPQKQQYVQLLQEKVQPYRDKARQYRQAALEKAYELGIFCPKVLACHRSLHPGEPLPAIARRQGVSRGPGAGEKSQPTSSIIQSLYADPGNSSLLLPLAFAHAAEGKPGLASLVLLRLLERNPREARAENLLGLLHLLQGQDAEAYACFRKALEFDSALAEAKANLVVLYSAYGNDRLAKASLDELAARRALATLDPRAVHPDFSSLASRFSAVAMQGPSKGDPP